MKTVLIVDDNSTNLYMLETLLKGYGYEVTSAENGKDALDKARLNPPDLIVTDILMPVMDGYALCRQWKSDDTLKHIPLVFYTATYTGSKNEEFALGLGAERFIIKPQEPEVLMNILKEVLAENYEVKQVATKPLEDEMEFFRQYNEILFSKLEKKMSDLEIANQKLRISEECYRLSFRNVSDVIYTIDKALNIISMSPSVERILGYKPQDFIGRPVSDLENILTPESFPQAIADIGLILKGETITSTVYRFIAKDGTTKVVEVSGSPLVREGEIIGIASVARDITERKKAEEALRRINAFLDSIIENIPNMIFIKDAGELRFIRFNRAGETLLGHSRDDLLGKNDYDFFPKDQADFFTEKDRDVLHGKEVVDIPEEPIQTRSKGERILHTKKVPIMDERGEPEYLLGISEDITDRKRAEERLKETLESLRKAAGATIQVMVHAVEARDPYTAGHQMRSAHLAQAIATGMGLSQEKIDGIRMAGSIHDIGKISIPSELLSKPTMLKDIELSLIKEHALRGYEMLKDVESPWPLAEIVYQHHERIDGTGYPRNLKGDEILLEARILAVADVVEAMASHRPYRPAKGIDAALEEIATNRGILYDPEVADACLKLFHEKQYRLT
jgi:PAS domain S-box-containing protein